MYILKKIYKERLRMKRYLCLTMTFLTLTNTAKGFNKNTEHDSSNSYTTVSYLTEHDMENWKTNSINDDFKLQEQSVDYLSLNPVQANNLEPEELTYQEKMLAIMEREGYTYEELDTICAGCVAESCEEGNCYEEGYNVASSLYNRAHCRPYVDYISSILGENAGYSIYYQFIAPNQFTVWSNESYKDYLSCIDLVGYQAAIDMFYSGIPSHNYLDFNNIPNEDMPSYQLNEGGNYYCHELLEEDKIKEEVEYKKVKELTLQYMVN